MDKNEDVMLANAARFLLDGGEQDAANVLLACTLSLEYVDTVMLIDGSGRDGVVYEVVLAGPRAAYEILSKQDHPMTKAIEKAIKAVEIPLENCYIREIRARVSVADIDPNWREELVQLARNKRVTNQLAEETKNVTIWQNLRFRSASEVRIAQALDKAGVLFFPNSRCRLTTLEGRQNKEPDFLVCHQGKWGILEVDGEPFHPPSRTAQDHERDRLFRQYGILVVEHFDASECFENAGGVVQRFLDILKKA